VCVCRKIDRYIALKDGSGFAALPVDVESTKEKLAVAMRTASNIMRMGRNERLENNIYLYTHVYISYIHTHIDICAYIHIYFYT